MTDGKIAAAVSAVEGQTEWPTMAEIPVRIMSTGRPAVLLLPADVTEAELAELVAWMLMNARPWIARQGSPLSRIIVPS